MTFSGLLLVAVSNLCLKSEKHRFWDRLHHQLVPSFAAGALLATAVFLLIPESMSLLQGSHSEDHEEEAHDERYLEEDVHHEEEEDESYHWKFGTSLLAGFLFPILLGAVFPPPDTSRCPECRRQQELALEQDETQRPLYSAEDALAGDESVTKEPQPEADTKDLGVADRKTPVKPLVSGNNDKDGTCSHMDHGEDCSGLAAPVVESSSEEDDKGTPHHSRNIPLSLSILLGDALHNFTDGIFIGNAFVLCSRSLAYTIVVTTIYHEIAQEIADYVLLTHHCGLSRPLALALNFVSGFSVMLGAVLILLLDLSTQATGVVLAISAGVYLHISATECIPRVIASQSQSSDRLWLLVCFGFGGVPIGLVLLNHGHCEDH